MQEAYSTFTSMGFQLIGVSPDQFSLSDIFAAEEDLNYPLYSDSDVALIEAFGLGWKIPDEKIDKYKNSKNEMLKSFGEEKHQTLPNPAIYVIKDGRVQYQYVNPEYSTSCY